MKQNFIFIFVLLTTLSTVSAVPYLRKRATKFGPCVIQEYLPELPIPSVTISPDPMVPGKTKTVDVTITTKLNSDVTADSGDLLEAAFLDADNYTINDPVAVKLCAAKGIKCPISSGTEFTTTLEKVPVLSKRTLGKDASFSVLIVTANYNFLACAQSEPIT